MNNNVEGAANDVNPQGKHEPIIPPLTSPARLPPLAWAEGLPPETQTPTRHNLDGGECCRSARTLYFVILHPLQTSLQTQHYSVGAPTRFILFSISPPPPTSTAVMASVTSLDHDMRKLRLDRYTPAAANQVRSWIEDALGEPLTPGDLMDALKDGVALCKYVHPNPSSHFPS